MPTSLYDLSVGTYLQVVGAAKGFLQKGADHAQAEGLSLDEIVATSLYPDMAPFHFQAVNVVHQSIGAIEALRKGECGPPTGYPQMDYPGLQQFIDGALDQLNALSADEINGLEGGQVVFKMGENAIPFTAANFVLSFSLPNLYFHTTTAYDILRMKGVPVGKIDFLGPMRIGA